MHLGTPTGWGTRLPARSIDVSIGIALLLGLAIGLAPVSRAEATDAGAAPKGEPALGHEEHPAPDPDLVASDRGSDSIAESDPAGQGQGGEPMRERSGIEEITVTAQKRSTDIQATPTAITAITGAELVYRGVYDIEQLANQVPNFQYGETFGIARITIRGVGNQGFTDPSTAFHIDGIYQNNPTAASALTFYDIAGVEVLRGPQGTLWGRNSTAGAINVSTRAPIHEFEIFGDVLGGSYRQATARGVVNVPIVQDVVATRIAGYVDKRDGFQENLFYPGSDQDADDADNWGLRPQVLIDPTDSIRIKLRGMYNHQGGVGWANKVTALASGLPAYNGFPLPYLFTEADNPLNPANSLYTWVDPYGDVNPNPTDPRQVWRDARQFQEIDTWNVNGALEWNFALPRLGDVAFNVVGSFRKETRRQNFDVDLTEADMVVSNVSAETEDRVIDAHLRSDGDSSTDWLVGFFMLDANGQLDIGLPGGGGSSNISPGPLGRICDLPTAGPAPELILSPAPGGGVIGVPDCLPFVPALLTLGQLNLFGGRTGGSNETLSLAAYGNLRQRFLDDRLTVSLGLRFTYDRSRATRYQGEVRVLSPGTTLLGIPIFDSTNNCVQPADSLSAEKDWAQVTGDLKVDYIPVDDHMVYGSISKGYKPGYINGNAVGVGFGPQCDPPNVQPLGDANREQIWAFEVGSKNRFRDDTIQANLTGFYYRYKNFQVSDRSENTTYISNADRARIWGIEFEGIWMPIDELTLSAVYGYLNARYTDYIGFNFATRDPAANYSGNQMIRAPEHQATLAMEYDLSLNRFGNLIPRVQYIISDKIYFTAANSEAEMQPWFGNLQIRLRWQNVDENLWLEGFVENLTDEDVQSTRAVSTAVLGLPITGAFQPPRTWGVRIGASY